MNKSYYGDLPSGVVNMALGYVHSCYSCHFLNLNVIYQKNQFYLFFTILGFVSPSYISNRWIKGYDFLHQEKSDIYQTGLKKGSYHQIDDTGARVKGKTTTLILFSIHLMPHFLPPLEKIA